MEAPKHEQVFSIHRLFRHLGERSACEREKRKNDETHSKGGSSNESGNPKRHASDYVGNRVPEHALSPCL